MFKNILLCLQINYSFQYLSCNLTIILLNHLSIVTYYCHVKTNSSKKNIFIRIDFFVIPLFMFLEDARQKFISEAVEHSAIWKKVSGFRSCKTPARKQWRGWTKSGKLIKTKNLVPSRSLLFISFIKFFALYNIITVTDVKLKYY